MESRKEPTIYQPEFIPYYPAIAENFSLSYLEVLVYGFIRFYTSSTNNVFYFKNDQIGFMLKRKERQISQTVNRLVEVGLVKAKYKVMANGGQMRYLKVNSDTRKTARQTSGKPRENENKINKNIRTTGTTLRVVDNNVDNLGTKGLSLIGNLLKEKTIQKVKGGATHEWQDRAVRYAEKLKITPDASWFRCFKINAEKLGRVDKAYSMTVDAATRDPKKYFYWALAH